MNMQWKFWLCVIFLSGSLLCGTFTVTFWQQPEPLEHIEDLQSFAKDRGYYVYSSRDTKHLAVKHLYVCREKIPEEKFSRLRKSDMQTSKDWQGLVWAFEITRDGTNPSTFVVSIYDDYRICNNVVLLGDKTLLDALENQLSHASP